MFEILPNKKEKRNSPSDPETDTVRWGPETLSPTVLRRRGNGTTDIMKPGPRARVGGLVRP